MEKNNNNFFIITIVIKKISIQYIYILVNLMVINLILLVKKKWKKYTLFFKEIQIVKNIVKNR